MYYMNLARRVLVPLSRDRTQISWKVESEKVGSKLNILKTKVKAFGLITSWLIDGGVRKSQGGSQENHSGLAFPLQGTIRGERV